MSKSANNKDLQKAKKDKKDEFYTQLSDIEREMIHYRDFFKGKVVLCNCDDPYESNFFKYFAMNFNFLGLKKLITTCYKMSPVANTQLSLFDYVEEKIVGEVIETTPHKVEITEVKDYNRDGAIDLLDIEYLLKNNKNTITELKGDGDFRSEECVEVLKEADVIVTNPPFSLFREYMAQLIRYDKKFIIIGHQNALTYKQTFKLIKEGKVWLGYGFKGNVGFFKSIYKDYAQANEHKDGLIRVSGVTWYTNVDHEKRNEELLLYKQYNEEEYPRYDNYNAIEVSKVKDIPKDYSGVMGVPITFIDKWNPEQFEILGITDRQNTSGLRTKKYTADDSKKYNDLNARSVIKLPNGEYKQKYARVLIRNKNVK